MVDPARPSIEESALFREFVLLVRHRKAVLVTLGIVVVAAVAYSLFTPKLYDARASLLPAADDSSPFSGFAGLLRDLPIQGANLPGVTTTTDVLAAMLRSRRLQEPIVREFDLLKRYKAETMEHAILTFNDALDAAVSDEGILHVRFRDKDPTIAAEIVNRLVRDLDSYNIEVGSNRNRLVADFVSSRIAETQSALDSAEVRLRDYQAEHSIAISPEDMAAAETVGQLIGRKLSLEVELRALSEFLDPKSPGYVQRESELRALEKEISRLPDLGLTAVKLYRDYKVQEQTLLFLRAQYEQARIDQHRNLSRIQVLDDAQPPVIRAWPKRKLIVLAAAVMGFGMSIVLAHFLEFWERNGSRVRRLVSAAP